MKLALLGDIALMGAYSSSSKEKLKVIESYLSQFDYVVGNLEAPFSYKRKRYGVKSPYICANPDSFDILKLLHVDALNLANNHIFDYGKEGYELTKQLLKENNIRYFGVEGKHLIIDCGDNKLAFSGFCCYSSNPLRCVPCGRYGINRYNLDEVCGIMKQHSERGCLNIISVHAGQEHVNYPSLNHIRAARMLANSYPYVYYGHHPHVIQGLENYHGSILSYSIGNFCFDDVYASPADTKPLVVLTENNRTGVILELIIEKNKVIKWREQVIHIGEDGVISLVDDDTFLSEYNKMVENCELQLDNYLSARSQIINNYVSDRKSKRDFIWYVKRLRLRYMKLFLNSKRNARLYSENVVKKLKI